MQRDGRSAAAGGTEKHSNEKESMRAMLKLIADLRIPMNSITGFAELLKESHEDKITTQSYLHNISTSSRFAVELIDMLEDIYRINNQDLEFQNEKFELNRVLDDLAHFMEDKKNEMGGSFVKLEKVKGSKIGFPIFTDRKRLELILSSLIENSLKYTKRGSITFGYEHPEPSVINFFVKDTGKSPSQERIQYILSSAHSDLSVSEFPFDSYALKLVYVDRIVKLMGGTFQIVAKPGDETEYYFSLPYSPGLAMPEDLPEDSAEPETGQTEKSPAEEPAEFNQSTILIAEDNSSNFILLQELLVPYKSNIVWAKNGEDAVEIIREGKQKVDLVLMDILMPKMDGYEAARLIKELRPELPVIAQTAYSIENVKDKSVLLNFDGYLIKPIWSVNLKEIVLKYLKKDK